MTNPDPKAVKAAEKVVDAAADAIKEAALTPAADPVPGKAPTGKAKAYVSTEPTYVGKKYYKPGEPFVTNETKGEHWEEISLAEKAAAEASSPQGAGDPSLEAMSQAGLEGLAAAKGVNGGGLSKAKLIAAIRAANEPRQ